MNIPTEDIEFIRNTLLPHFGVDRVQLAWSGSKKAWPDIWVSLNGIPRITVTQEWLRQSKDERKKRLVHEFLHIAGMEHDESIGYSTVPARDKYSMKIYRGLIR